MRAEGGMGGCVHSSMSGCCVLRLTPVHCAALPCFRRVLLQRLRGAPPRLRAVLRGGGVAQGHARAGAHLQAAGSNRMRGTGRGGASESAAPGISPPTVHIISSALHRLLSSHVNPTDSPLWITVAQPIATRRSARCVRLRLPAPQQVQRGHNAASAPI